MDSVIEPTVTGAISTNIGWSAAGTGADDSLVDQPPSLTAKPAMTALIPITPTRIFDFISMVATHIYDRIDTAQVAICKTDEPPETSHIFLDHSD
jgi:hypothetical protein